MNRQNTACTIRSRHYAISYQMIWFGLKSKLKAASVSAVDRCLLRLIRIGYNTVFVVLRISMYIYIIICTEPSVQFIFACVCSKALHGKVHGCSRELYGSPLI